MVYRISSGYPFFIIVFLQVVVFAGFYFKLGDLLSMFSLHDDGARGMGRYILHRPRMFLHHQLHRLNRTMRAASASRPNGGTGSGSNGANSGTGAGRSPRGSSAGGWYRGGPYGGSSPSGRTGHPSSLGGMNAIPGAAVPGLFSGWTTGPRGKMPGGKPPGAPHSVSGSTNGAAPGNPSSGASPALPPGNAFGGASPASLPGNAAAGNVPSGSMPPSLVDPRTRPVVLLPAPAAGQQVSGANPVRPMAQALLPPPPQRPAAANVQTPVQDSGSPAHSTVTQPHERPAVTQTDTGERMKQPDRPNVTAAKQPVHAESRRLDAVNRPAAMQNAADKPITSSTAAVQGKQDTVRPVVKTAAPKEPEMKNQVSKPADKCAVQHKQPVTMRNKPDGTGHTGKSGGTQNGGGGR